MKSYTKVDISEAALEDLVRQGPCLIEEGLVYVDHQKSTIDGRLDVLLVDSGKALVVAELKVVEDDTMLLQGVDYYDYVRSHIHAFAHVYKAFGINPDQQPRLMLIAPSFSPTLVGRCKWLDLPLSLFTFNCIRFEGDSEPVAVYAELPIPTQPAIIEVARVEQHLSYITDSSVRMKVTSLLEEIKSWKPSGILIDPIKYAVSMKVNGRVFAYLSPRRKFYVLDTYNADRVWTAYAIKDENDLARVKPIVRDSMEWCALI